jgi:hypothetical protein
MDWLDNIIETVDKLYKEKGHVGEEPNGFGEHLDHFLRCVVEELLPAEDKQKIVYITAPIWSVNQIDPKGKEGFWRRIIPLYVGENGSCQMESLLVLLGLISTYSPTFNLTTFICRDQTHKIPHCVKFEQELESEPNCDSSPFSCVYLPIPMMGESEGLREILQKASVKNEVNRIWSSCPKESQNKDEFYVKADEFLSNLADPISESETLKKEKIFAETDHMLENQSDFETFCTTVNDRMKEELIEKLGIRVWEDDDSQKLSKFLYLYRLIDFGTVYFIPSRTVIEKGKEFGAGGMVLVTMKGKRLKQDTLKKLWLAINIEYGRLFGVDWAQKARSEGKREIALDISHMLKNRFYARYLPLLTHYGKTNYVIAILSKILGWDFNRMIKNAP